MDEKFKKEEALAKQQLDALRAEIDRLEWLMTYDTGRGMSAIIARDCLHSIKHFTDHWWNKEIVRWQDERDADKVALAERKRKRKLRAVKQS